LNRSARGTTTGLSRRYPRRTLSRQWLPTARAPARSKRINGVLAIMNIRALYRYPVKGLSAESLPSVALLQAHGVPIDRAYAVTDGSLDFDEHQPAPAPKTQFLMLAKYEKLAQLKTRFIDETSELDVSFGDTSWRYHLANEADRQKLAAFLH